MNILNLQKKNCILSQIKQNFRKIDKSLDIFLTTPDEVDKYAKMMQSNTSDNCLHRYDVMILNLFETKSQLTNTKPMIKKKVKRIVE